MLIFSLRVVMVVFRLDFTTAAATSDSVSSSLTSLAKRTYDVPPDLPSPYQHDLRCSAEPYLGVVPSGTYCDPQQESRFYLSCKPRGVSMEHAKHNIPPHELRKWGHCPSGYACNAPDGAPRDWSGLPDESPNPPSIDCVPKVNIIVVSRDKSSSSSSSTTGHLIRVYPADEHDLHIRGPDQRGDLEEASTSGIVDWFEPHVVDGAGELQPLIGRSRRRNGGSSSSRGAGDAASIQILGPSAQISAALQSVRAEISRRRQQQAAAETAATLDRSSLQK